MEASPPPPRARGVSGVAWGSNEVANYPRYASRPGLEARTLAANGA